MTRKKVKLKDIADELGISIVSASNALNGKKGVSEELRQKVLATAERLGYEMVRQSSLDSDSDITQIGVLIAERYVQEKSSFYMDVYRMVALAATKKGCVTVMEMVSREKENLEVPFTPFLHVGVQGIIVIGEMDARFIHYVNDGVLPVVCLDFYARESGLDYIITDGFYGMERMTSLLIEAGHRDIGFVGTPRATNSIMDRYLGYCRALKRFGLKEKEEYLLFDRELNNETISFELPNKLPKAYVCNCDKTAYLLIKKLEDRGLRVPEDISVVGFDYSMKDKTGRLKLTTYESNQKAMATIGVNCVLKRIQGKRVPEGVRVVQGRVIEGNTVAPVNTPNGVTDSEQGMSVPETMGADGEEVHHGR